VRADEDTAPDSVVDGRRARRERGRLAVSDAMVDLVFEGRLPPTAEQVAERAGVSIASLFRYFETLDEMRLETTKRYFDRYSDVFDVPAIGEGTLDQRIGRFVEARLRLHETTEPMARFARLRAAENESLATTLRLVRAARADQIRRHFEPELRALSPAARDDVVATISALTSFEAWDQFRNDHDRSQRQTGRAWQRALGRLLDSNNGGTAR
jgi:AcrR family transcriptional regulator